MDTEASVSRDRAASRRRPTPAPGRPLRPGSGAGGIPPALPDRLSEAQRISLLVTLTAPEDSSRCLLVEQRGESTVLRDMLIAAGGDWTTTDVGVNAAGACHLPFPDGAFDRVVVVDVRAALADPSGFDREMARVLAAGGAAIIAEPTGATGRLRGSSWSDLHDAMLEVGLRPVARAAHSGFFARLADATLRRGAARARGQAPWTEDRSVLPRSRGRMAHLAVRVCTFLDGVVRGRGGAPVIVALKAP